MGSSPGHGWGSNSVGLCRTWYPQGEARRPWLQLLFICNCFYSSLWQVESHSCAGGCRGSAATSPLSVAASRGRSCRFVAGAMQQSEGLLLPPPNCHCHLESIVAPSLTWPVHPTSARAVKGSAVARRGGCKPLPMAGRAQGLLCSTAAFPYLGSPVVSGWTG